MNEVSRAMINRVICGVILSLSFSMVKGGFLESAEKIEERHGVELSVLDHGKDTTHVLVHGERLYTVGDFLAKGAYPLHVKISNKSDRPIAITDRSLDIDLVDPYALARKFHKDNQFTQFLLFESIVVGNLWGWGSYILPCLVFPPWFFIGIVIAPAIGTVAGVYHWIAIWRKNSRLNDTFIRDLPAKRTDAELIYPGQTVKKLILIDKEKQGMIKPFLLKLFQNDRSSIAAVFTVQIG